VLIGGSEGCGTLILEHNFRFPRFYKVGTARAHGRTIMPTVGEKEEPSYET